VTGGSPEATGTPRLTREWRDGAPVPPGPAADPAFEPAAEPPAEEFEHGSDTIARTRFAHASEAEMARILDFYAVRWEYEPTTFPILWNLEGDVVESFAPDFYLPELELFLEMTTLKQRLVRKKNRKLRRLRELYPDIRIKLFYARDFRAMMLKYGRLALAEALSGTPGQMVPERAHPEAGEPIMAEAVAVPASRLAAEPAEPAESAEPSGEEVAARSMERATPRTRARRRRRRAPSTIVAGAEQEAGA
jgi:hypoxanthine phosphoribosyltransferase